MKIPARLTVPVSIAGLAFLPLLTLWIGIVWDVDLPGVYMDAVNPDYAVVRMIGGEHRPDVWVLPGNMIAGRIPILTSLYHGTIQAWIGAPLFAILGTSVESLRVVHGLFATVVLLSSMFWLMKAGLSRVLVSLIGVIIAIDPAFLFCFRTQSYITMAPVAALLGSLICLELATEKTAQRKWLTLSGALFGLSIYGYFIYAFFLPAMLAAVFFWPSNRLPRISNPKRMFEWSKGLFIGCLLYLVGYARAIYNLGGLTEFCEYVFQMQRALTPFSSALGLPERLQHELSIFGSVTENWWNSYNWIGAVEPIPMGEIKTRLLLFLPFVLLVFAEVRKHSNRFLRVSVGMMVSFLLVALIFGGRLGGHHFVPLLVLSYLASAIGVFQTLGPLKLGCNAYFRCAPIGVMAAALIVQSVWGQLETRAKLRETGGVALFSDAINRFAESLSKRNFSGYVVTPDWGLYMPIIFLTGGKFHVVTELDTNHARKLLCNGTDLLYSLVVPDRKARVDELALNLDWDQFTIEAFRQRNGPVVFEVATFWGDRKSVKCISRATH